jgi:photosystem II stability/assembly factor-like uncharacterized protein
MAAHETRRWRRLGFASAALITAAATGCGTALAQSGQTRSPAASAPRVRLAVVQMTSATTGWALRFTGNPAGPSPVSLALIRSTDGGRRWSNITTLPGAQPNLLDAVTGSQAWLVVTTRSHSYVLSTTDGGVLWKKSIPLPPGGAASLSFSGTAHGWLLQSLGAATGSEWVDIYRTVDSDRYWSLVAHTPPAPDYGTSSSGLPTGCDKGEITFSSPRTGWLPCFSPAPGYLLLVSKDAGSHWASQGLPLSAGDCPYGCTLSPPQFFGRTGFMTADRQPHTAALLVTTDGGARWHLARLPGGAGLNPQIQFFSSRQGVIVPMTSQATPARVFYVTANGGRTWTAVRQGMRFGMGFGIDFVTTRTGFAWANDANVPSGGPPDMYQTTNSGRTWQALAPLLG